MFKAAVHSCVSCHNLLCLICCSTWRRIKVEAFVTVSFCPLWLCPCLRTACFKSELARLWWLREIEFQSAWLITISNGGERCACSEAFLQPGNYLCALGIRYLVETARRLPILDSYHLIFIHLLLEGFSASHGLPCPSPIWAALFSCTFVGLPSACDWHTSYFQIHYRLLTAVGNQFEESITNVLFENASS